MANKYIVRGNLKHDERRYAPGEEIDCLSGSEAKKLLARGVIGKLGEAVEAPAKSRKGPEKVVAAKEDVEPSGDKEAGTELPKGLNPAVT